jgi:tetratricopeptide (TPR) repeat protein
MKYPRRNHFLVLVLVAVATLFSAWWAIARRTDPDRGTSRWNINEPADQASIQGHFAKAERLYSDAIRQAEAIGVEDETLAHSLVGLGQAVSTWKDEFARCEDLFQRAQAMLAHGGDPANLAACAHNLGNLYSHYGKYSQAESQYKWALAIYRKCGRERSDGAVSSGALGTVYAGQGRYREAERLFKEYLEFEEQAFGPKSPILASTLEDLSFVTYVQGRPAQSERYWRRAIAIAKQQKPNGDTRWGNSARQQAKEASTRGDTERAKQLWGVAAAQFGHAFGFADESVSQCLGQVADLCESQRKTKEAEFYRWQAELQRGLRAQ